MLRNSHASPSPEEPQEKGEDKAQEDARAEGKVEPEIPALNTYISRKMSNP